MNLNIIAGKFYHWLARCAMWKKPYALPAKNTVGESLASNISLVKNNTAPGAVSNNMYETTEGMSLDRKLTCFTAL